MHDKPSVSRTSFRVLPRQSGDMRSGTPSDAPERPAGPTSCPASAIPRRRMFRAALTDAVQVIVLTHLVSAQARASCVM